MRDLDDISILLVTPKNPGNIGAAARAMKNMGLRRLKLVEPCDPLADESVAFAVGAVDLLQEASVFSSFEEAVSEEHLVLGTTSTRGRRVRARVLSVREAAGRLRSLAAGQRACIVFGPERSGLTEEQLARCGQLIRIPTSPDFPTLNLAQAVLLIAYEIYTCTSGHSESELERADQVCLDQMFTHMESTLREIGFLSVSNPGHIMRSIRRFLGRADLTPRDIRIVRGILRQMDWYVRKGQHLDPEHVRKP